MTTVQWMLNVGQRVPNFTLTDLHNQPVNLARYRGQKNLVLVFLGSVAANEIQAMLKEYSSKYSRIQEENGQVVVFLPLAWQKAVSELGELPFPVLLDADEKAHRSLLAGGPGSDLASAVLITDRFGEIYAAYRKGEEAFPPSVEEVLRWLNFIEIQCPECGAEEWPA